MGTRTNKNEERKCEKIKVPNVISPTGKVSHVEHGSSHESKLFRMKLLNAFRSVDPHVEDGMVNRFYRFYRNPA
ncbi:hypothetical protein WR25_11520 [Diploscapter pachys]|uniref:Uncharacterized protein n=1 Tax=Diploscapter pachys TaxID=2018661 RepID=A0A2A2JKI4_9BILA|nr:hypothetical protein WR25_11520 [Diploscapter pachys]